MIQSYEELIKSIDEYNNLLLKDQKANIQKIFSTPHLICLIVRHPGSTKYLYLGRGSNYEGFWMGESRPQSQYRIRDRFLEYLRRYLEGSKILAIKVDKKDRILSISYKKQQKENEISFFWKGRNLYFLNIFFDEQEKRNLFLSWEKLIASEIPSTLASHDIAIDKFDSIGRKSVGDINRKIRKNNFLETYFLDLDKRLKNSKIKNRKVKFYERKIEKIKKDLQKVKSWKGLEEFLKTGEMDVFQKQVFEIHGIKFKTKEEGPYKKRDIVYKKIKKLKLAEAILKKRLKECEDSFLEIRKCEIKRNIGSIKILQPVWSPKESLKKDLSISDKSFSFDEFFLLEKVRFSIGKNSQTNDFLRSRWANKNDLWFHIDGYKGSHLFIKVKSINDLTMEDIRVLASILRDYSGLMIETIPLVFTQVKNLKGVKGSAGKVLYKKEKYLSITYQKKWRKLISKV